MPNENVCSKLQCLFHHISAPSCFSNPGSRRRKRRSSEDEMWMEVHDFHQSAARGFSSSWKHIRLTLVSPSRYPSISGERQHIAKLPKLSSAVPVLAFVKAAISKQRHCINTNFSLRPSGALLRRLNSRHPDLQAKNNLCLSVRTDKHFYSSLQPE